jgi:hypothetical protein
LTIHFGKYKILKEVANTRNTFVGEAGLKRINLLSNAY